MYQSHEKRIKRIIKKNGHNVKKIKNSLTKTFYFDDKLKA
jgi:hypothetical protein